MRWLVLMLPLASLACAPRTDDVTRVPEPQFRTSPSPEGCYVSVWEGPQFTGRSNYINGPQSYANLRGLPNRQNWERRIVSVRVGPTAVATAFVYENFLGSGFELPARAEFGTLPQTVSGRILSLRVRCRGASDANSTGRQ